MRPRAVFERWRAAVVAVAVLAGVGFAPGTGLAAGGQCRGIESAAGGWSVGPLPDTPSLPGVAPEPIIATSSIGSDPTVELATDGTAVFRTTDGGCNWHTVFTLGPIDYYEGVLLSGYSVTSIANGHDARPANQQDVYLALSPNPLNAFTLVTLFGAAPPELVAASHDGGTTFTIVQPQPSAANPIVPECISSPALFVVPPTDGHTIYLQCSGGLAQTVADEALTGGGYPMYRSTDGGLSWNLIGLPAPPSYGSNAHWLVPGVHKNELWMVGYWTSTTTPSHNYLAVWRSVDAGTTWARLLPDAKPLSSSGSATAAVLAVDTAPGAGWGQVAVYNSLGTYLSADDGKHWRRLRAVTFTNGSRPPAAGFFLRHVLHVLYAGEISCKGQPVIVRYPTAAARPVSVPFPSKWGIYGGWASDSTFAVTDRGFAASGLARFCATSISGVTSTKLLTLRAR